jgi:DNA-binding SARP family transcriptional activator
MILLSTHLRTMPGEIGRISSLPYRPISTDGSGIRIQVLGPVRAWRDGEKVELGRPAQRAVLGLLALAPGQPLSRAELVDALWRDAPPAQAVNVIQTHLKHLRRLLEPDRARYAASRVLPVVGDGYALQLPDEAVDLARFRRLVASATRALDSGGQGEAASLLGQALRLWSASPLVDVPLLAEHPKAVALAAERRAALLHYGESMIASGAARDVLATLEELATAQPFDEAAQALLIRALHATGRRQQALACFTAVRRRLADELGIDPGPELAAAHAAALCGDTGYRVRPDPRSMVP